MYRYLSRWLTVPRFQRRRRFSALISYTRLKSRQADRRRLILRRPFGSRCYSDPPLLSPPRRPAYSSYPPPLAAMTSASSSYPRRRLYHAISTSSLFASAAAFMASFRFLLRLSAPRFHRFIYPAFNIRVRRRFSPASTPAFILRVIRCRHCQPISASIAFFTRPPPLSPNLGLRFSSRPPPLSPA